jgi:adenylate cyclase class 2
MDSEYGSIEVERKRLLEEPEAVAERLRALGYEASAAASEVDVYYSRPDVDYLATVECLRVRRRGDFAEITYKPPSTAATHSSGDIIAKRETNVRLVKGEDVDAAHDLLVAIGMVPLVAVQKSRTTWRHPADIRAIVCIDVLADIGTFIETEVTTDDAEEAATLLQRLEVELGVTDCTVVAAPYRDIALEHRAAGEGLPRP